MQGAKRKWRVNEEEVLSLRRFLHRGGISVSGLAELLQTLRAHPLTDAGSLHYLRDANAIMFNMVRRSIVLPRVGGGTVEWPVADPNKLLALAVSRSPLLKRLYTEAMQRFPCSERCPCRLAIGFDEFEPGCV